MLGTSIVYDSSTVNHYINYSHPYEKLETHLHCKQRCIEKNDCQMWTHIGGNCILKTENNFIVDNALLTSGQKGCSTSGKRP